MGKILVGTASWTDPGFVADWYPKWVSAADRLRWYAEHFPLVEVDSTFYRIPVARFVERWSEQTPDPFVFDVKLHQLLSRHSTRPELLPPDLRAKAAVKGKRVELTPALEAAVTKRFLAGVQPLEESGKLGALLLQLSPSFDPNNHQLSELDSLLKLLKGRRVAIELRNRRWVAAGQLAQTEAWFKQHKVSFVLVDAPDDPHFMIMPKLDLVTNRKLAYLRAHGRNARSYIAGRTVAARFAYDYNKKELEEMAQRALNIAQHAGEIHLVFNNNASNFAPKAATAIQNILRQEHPEAVPKTEAQEEFSYA
ncbi:MAG: hypothetical protein JWR19_3524 [Pedosphaera sp.]|nr:hypothetical protein [Pedosphaera sp.]